MHRINLPEVVAEVTAVFERYEKALVANDVAVLNALFWESPLTLRFGIAENLYGHAAIAAYRAAHIAVPSSRRLRNTVITTYGRDIATASTEFIGDDPRRIGRQSQTWLRFPEGWRIVSAHVSVIEAC